MTRKYVILRADKGIYRTEGTFETSDDFILPHIVRVTNKSCLRCLFDLYISKELLVKELRNNEIKR